MAAIEPPIDPGTHMKVAAYVGSFLREWSFMESAVNEAIGKALGLDVLQTVIVTSNIMFRDKIFILRTALSVMPISPAEERNRADRTLIKISNYAKHRNMVAHETFAPSDDSSGVKFFVYRAKGTVEIPKIVWSFKKFDAEFKKLRCFADTVNALIPKLERAILLKTIMDPKRGWPSGELAGLGLAGLLFHPPEDNHSSDTNPATPETDPRTPSSDDGE